MAWLVTLWISKIATRWIAASQRSEITISWSTLYSAGTDVPISKSVHSLPCCLTTWSLSVFQTSFEARLDPKSAFFPHITALDAYLFYDVFVNCNWVVPRWQQYSTHLHTNNTQNDTKQTIHRTTQQLEECGPCPVLASYTLAFASQPRKKHGKTSVRVAASKNT